jgi:hypothetical protein
MAAGVQAHWPSIIILVAATAFITTIVCTAPLLLSPSWVTGALLRMWRIWRALACMGRTRRGRHA